MLIDHIGVALYPDLLILRLIGRLSMPLFAFCVAQAYIHYENSGKMIKYAEKLLVFTVFSQIPYVLLFDGVNIGATWLISLLLLMNLTIEDKNNMNYAIIGLCLFFTVVFDVCYGLYGVFMPVLFYYWLKYRFNKYYDLMVYMLLMWAVYVAIHGWTVGALIQVVSVGVIPLFAYANNRPYKKILPSGFYYWFYPVHLLILFLVQHYFN